MNAGVFLGGEPPLLHQCGLTPRMWMYERNKEKLVLSRGEAIMLLCSLYF